LELTEKGSFETDEPDRIISGKPINKGINSIFHN